MATTFFTIHHYLAEGQEYVPLIDEHQAKANMKNKDSLAAVPILGLAVGTVGLVVAIAGVIFGGLAALVLAIPVLCCDHKTSQEHLKVAREVFVTGLKLTVAYPLMMVYGLTLGWFTHTCLFNNPINFGCGEG